MTAIFPTEVFERIIDYVWPDQTRRTLMACMFVCRAWFPRARVNLIYEIILRHPRQLRLFAQLVGKRPALRPLIHILHIWPSRADDCKVMGTFPLMLAHHLPNLRSLSMRGLTTVRPIARYPQSHHLTFPILREFSFLTILMIGPVHFTSMTTFARLVGSFTSLTILVCQGITWGNAERSPSAYKPIARLKLRSISIGYMKWTEQLADMLLAIIDPTSLHTLNLRPNYQWYVEHAEGLLEAIGPSLQHLVIGEGATVEAKYSGSYLAYNTSITKLWMTSHPNYESEVATCNLLSRVHAPSLQELILSLSSVPYSLSDQFLSRPGLNPREIVFENMARFPRAYREASRLSSEVRDRLPQTYSRGVVRFENAPNRSWWEVA
ncbi:uncharacterized protein B0H18DRAFT_1009809 [Fomitopsis serialis]|uniref:uncharacterized protein n=1 Tax=Fomitopsis serialis TaxID=139415 RepID=UPI002007DD5B|nr:uncharacterized protein B0H18DRAFT_1009809 [Neoantrodia serialis]KAH9925099.1 hypothetical protein B0H18DRAFT_1009809 [Neoantrodia serialis]